MRDERMDDGKVRRIRPQQSVAAERAGADPSTIRRRGRRSKSGVRVEHRVQRLQMAMVIILCTCVLAILGAGVYIERIKTEKETIFIEALRLERELSEATAALETVTKDRDDMVNARIPGLERLNYDESIQVGKLYVRNIIFTLAVKNETPSYEYRVVFSKRCGVFVPCVEELFDSRLQLLYAFVRTALDLFGRQDAEPTFHLVEPGGVGGDEVEVEPRVVGQPPLDGRGAVRRVVVDDDVNIELWWDVSADLIEELSELDRAVAGKALADDVASGLVQGREERRRPVALVLGRAPRGLPRTQRQHDSSATGSSDFSGSGRG